MKKTSSLFVLIMACFSMLRSQSSSFDQAHFDSLLYTKPDQAYDYVAEFRQKPGISDTSSIRAINLLGAAAWVNGDLLLAAEHYIDCMRLLDSLGLPNEAINVHLNLGSVFNDLEAYKLAKREYRYGMRPPFDPHSYLNIATVFIREESYDSATHFLQQAINLYEENGDKYGLGLAFYNLGLVALEVNNIDKVAYYLNMAEDIFEQQGNHKMLLTNNLARAKLLAKQGEPLKAIELAIIITDSATQIGFGEIQRDGHEFLYEMYKGQNRQSESLAELERKLEAEKLLKGKGNSDISSIITTYFTQKMDGEKILAQNERLKLQSALQSEKVMNNTLLSVGIVVVVIIISMVYSQRQKSRRRALELQLQKDQKNKLSSNLENMQKLSKQRQRQLHLQEKQLLTHSLREAELNQFLTKVIEQLENPSDDQTPRRVAQSIRQFRKQTDGWDHFRTHFEGIHESFFTSLSAKHKLTGNDLKVAALSVLGFSAKQMGDILGIKASSVDISRHRLRKKLSLEAEQSLTDYLRSYLN